MSDTTPNIKVEAIPPGTIETPAQTEKNKTKDAKAVKDLKSTLHGLIASNMEAIKTATPFQIMSLLYIFPSELLNHITQEELDTLKTTSENYSKYLKDNKLYVTSLKRIINQPYEDNLKQLVADIEALETPVSYVQIFLSEIGPILEKIPTSLSKTLILKLKDLYNEQR